MFSDAFEYKEVNGIFYEVKGKAITEDSTVNDSLIGGKKSAGDEEGDIDVQVRSVIDIVASSKLKKDEHNSETPEEIKKQIKNYSKNS